jgi:hypothetical protein
MRLTVPRCSSPVCFRPFAAFRAYTGPERLPWRGLAFVLVLESDWACNCACAYGYGCGWGGSGCAGYGPCRIAHPDAARLSTSSLPWYSSSDISPLA